MRPWWLRLARYALPQWKGLSFSAVLMVIGVALDVLKPWPLKLVIDSVLANEPLTPSTSWLYALPGGESPKALLAWLTAGTIVLFLGAWGARMTQSYVQAGAGSRMVHDLGGELFHHLQRLSLRFHGRHSAGDLVRQVTANAGCVRVLVIGALLPALGSLLSLATMFAVMWRLDPSLSLLAILAAPPLGVLIRRFARPMEERSSRQMQLEGDLMGLAEQTLTALPIVQAFSRESAQDRRFSELCLERGRAYVRTLLAQLQFGIGAESVTAMATAVVLAVGGFHVLQGSLTVGGLLVFFSYLTSLYSPMVALAYLSTSVATASAGAHRIFETLDTNDHVREHPQARPLPASGRGVHVRLEGVTFGYEPGRPVLLNVNLEALPGETVALVGATGAGKSTLVSLIPRFYDPWEGNVTINGMDVRELKLASLREQIAFVLQDPFLLPMSVAENIAYGRPGASPEQIVEAAIAASADKFIRKLPAGYDTVIGERGATLSAGQRQRLSIARALLKDAPILILDEPTSALDAQTEAELLAALARLLKGRTSFVIAHRLSTVRNADWIVIMDGGRVAEEGTHEELLRHGALYARFYELQGGNASLQVVAQ